LPENYLQLSLPRTSPSPVLAYLNRMDDSAVGQGGGALLSPRLALSDADGARDLRT